VTKSKNILPPRKIWSALEVETLKKRYPIERAEDIALDFGCSLHVVYSKAHKLGLKKSDAFKQSYASGRLDGSKGTDTRFKKGNVPWTKGTHFVAGGRSAETRFKPKESPHNQVPVGTTVMATIGYLKTKIAQPNKWKFTHHLRWEEIHGPIEPGMMLVFKTSDRTNCDPSNLELVTRQEHMARHTVQNLPDELKEIIQLTGALKRKINNHVK
jgi:hypothetical protein